MQKIVTFVIAAALVAPVPAAARQDVPDRAREEAAMRSHLEALRLQLRRHDTGLAEHRAALAELAAQRAAGEHQLRAQLEAAHAQQLPHLDAQIEALRHQELSHLRSRLEAARLSLDAARLEHAGIAAFDDTGHAHLPEAFAPQDPADSLYRRARDLLARSDYREAVAAFRRIRTEQRFQGSAYAPVAYYWEAFALSRLGTDDELRRARELLALYRERHPRDRQIREAEALSASIAGRLARAGDADAAREITTSARALSDQCPMSEGDVRLVALNALIQMDAANAVPILREVMARRDECSAPLRRRAVLLLGQKRDAGLDEILVDVVRNDPDPEVREAAVMWLAHSSDPEAFAALEQILRTSTDREMQQRALMALSQGHRDDRTASLLRDYAARTDVPVDLRRHAVMSLSHRRDAGTAEFLRGLYAQLSDEELKEQVIFAVAEMRDARNAEWLLDIATRENENAEIRKRALFFAAQQPQVPVDRIVALYDVTRDREMKEQILFALSQRTREPAVVDKLMDIGRNESDPELRNRAVFWLSQSRDPRVPAFLLEIIKR